MQDQEKKISLQARNAEETIRELTDDELELAAGGEERNGRRRVKLIDTCKDRMYRGRTAFWVCKMCGRPWPSCQDYMYQSVMCDTCKYCLREGGLCYCTNTELNG